MRVLLSDCVLEYSGEHIIEGLGSFFKSNFIQAELPLFCVCVCFGDPRAAHLLRKDQPGLFSGLVRNDSHSEAEQWSWYHELLHSIRDILATSQMAS